MHGIEQFISAIISTDNKSYKDGKKVFPLRVNVYPRLFDLNHDSCAARLNGDLEALVSSSIRFHLMLISRSLFPIHRIGGSNRLIGGVVNPENLGQTWRGSLFQTVIRFKRQRFERLDPLPGSNLSFFFSIIRFFFFFFLLPFFFPSISMRIHANFPIISKVCMESFTLFGKY